MSEGVALQLPGVGRRRALLAAGAAVLAGPGGKPALAAIPSSHRIGFNVIREGSQIGTHVLTFEPAGERLVVQVAVNITVRLLGIVVYRYSLRATETWEGGVLQQAVSDTQDGSDKDFMRAVRQGERMRVEGSHGKPYVAPLGSICATHWNPLQLKAPMINVQDGELLDFTVAPRGRAMIEVRGGQLEAEHFALTGPAVMDLWYDDAKVWSRLRAVVRDGSTVEYRAT